MYSDTITIHLPSLCLQVGYINFDAFYRPTWRQQEQHEFIVDSDEPLEEEETSTIHKKAHLTESIPHDLVHVNEISSSFITFRVQDNILTQSTEHIMMVSDVSQIYTCTNDTIYNLFRYNIRKLESFVNCVLFFKLV